MAMFEPIGAPSVVGRSAHLQPFGIHRALAAHVERDLRRTMGREGQQLQ